MYLYLALLLVNCQNMYLYLTLLLVKCLSMYLYLTLLLLKCLSMYLYLTPMLVKCLSMHLYLTLLLVSWPKDPLGGKTEYAAPRLQEATFLFQADTVEVQHVAPFFPSFRRIYHVCLCVRF